MTQWRLWGRGTSVQDGNAAAGPISGTRNAGASQAEAGLQNKIYLAYTFSDFAAYVSAADASATSYLRDDGVSSSNLSVAGSSTGYVEDLTGSDTPAINSLMSAYHDDSAAMHGATYSVTAVNVTYEHGSTDQPLFAESGVNLSDGPNATSEYRSIHSRAWAGTTESDAQHEIYRTQTFANLRIYATGTITVASFALRKNGSTSTNLAVSPSSSGGFEDVTGSEAYAADDLINYIGNGTSGVPLNISSSQVDADTAEAAYLNGENTFPSSSSAEVYAAILTDSGTAGASLNDNTITARMGSISAGNFAVTCTTYTSGTDTAGFRINGTNSTNLTVSITATGRYEDIAGSDSIADGDKPNYVMTPNNSSTVAVARPQIEMPWSSVDTSITGSIASTMVPASSSATGVMQPEGTAASTLVPASASATGTHVQNATGTAASTLVPASSDATGIHAQTGTAASTLVPASADATGDHKQTGTVASTLVPASADATGHMVPTGTAAMNLVPASLDATGELAISGTAASTLAPTTADATGVMQPEGTAASSLVPVTADATGVQIYTGTIASTLAVTTADASGTQSQSGSAASTLVPVSADASGSQIFSGSASSSISAVTASASGHLHAMGSAASTLVPASADAAGTTGTNEGTAASTIATVSSSATGYMVPEGTAASTLVPVTSAASGNVISVVGTAAPSLVPASSDATGSHGQSGTASSTLVTVTATASGTQSQVGTASSSLVSVSASASGYEHSNGTAACAILPVYATMIGVHGDGITDADSRVVTVPSIPEIGHFH